MQMALHARLGGGWLFLGEPPNCRLMGLASARPAVGRGAAVPAGPAAAGRPLARPRAPLAGHLAVVGSHACPIGCWGVTAWPGEITERQRRFRALTTHEGKTHWLWEYFYSVLGFTDVVPVVLF